MNCYDCPRHCGADRDKIAGVCGGRREASVAKVIDPFTFEEPCLGEKLCAVFFGGCSLRCTYCQNYAISRGECGKRVSDGDLAEIFDGSQSRIDLVTPTHYIGAIERAVKKCKRSHSYIYNTSGYETAEGVRRAAAFADVFLTDYKYADEQTGRRFSAAPDYFTVAADALELMRETPDEWVDDGQRRILRRGLIVRHLVLPGCVENSIAALDTIKRRVGNGTALSLMSQFTPNGVGEPSEKLKRIEYKIVAEHALKLGFGVGYFQGFDSADKKFTPDF